MFSNKIQIIQKYKESSNRVRKILPDHQVEGREWFLIFLIISTIFIWGRCRYYNIIKQMPLTEQQIKQQQLKLLEVSGFCLAEYCDSSKQSIMFRDISNQTTEKELAKLKTLKIKSAGVSANANLKAFLCVMLHSIYMGDIKEEILDNVKSALYNDQIDLTAVKNSTLPYQSNDQLKKLVVEFFYSIKYSHFDDRVESKLAKYPIIMDILVVFLRKILSKYNVKNADDLIFHIPTRQAYSLLVDFFDLNCKAQNQLYLFYEDRFFIFENEHGEMMMGCYAENQHQKENSFKNPFLPEDSEDKEEDEKQDDPEQQESPNRSLEFRGIVSESVVIDPDTATPFFNFDQESLSSFKTSRGPSQFEEGAEDQDNQTLMKMSKEVSLLKKMDRVQNSQQLGLGSNMNMKRTVILEGHEDHIQANKNQELFRQILGTPITMNSPHTLQLPFDQNFTQNQEKTIKVQQQKRDIKVLKKSHSEKMSKPAVEEQKREANLSEDPDFSQKPHSKPNNFNNKKKDCQCVIEKKRKIKLNSSLYEINVTYVQEQLRFSKKNIFVVSTGKPVSQVVQTVKMNPNGIIGTSNQKSEVKKGFPKGPQGGTFFKKMNKIFFRNQRDKSMNEASHVATQNPESLCSDSFSKREISPLSNNRSISPHSATSKPTTPPKLSLNKNPLKYSTRLKSAMGPTKNIQ